MTGGRRRRLGRALTTIGAISMALTVVAAVVAVALVGSLHHSVDESLAVTVDALDTIDGTLDVSRQVIDSVSAALDAVGDTVTTVGESTDAVSGTLDSLQGLVGTTLPTAVDGVQNALPTIKTVAGTIDVRARRGVADSVRAGLHAGGAVRRQHPAADRRARPARRQPRHAGHEPHRAGHRRRRPRADVTAIQTALDSIRADVDSAKEELDRYSAVTVEARRVAAAARADLQRDVTWMRVLVVIVALALLATQALTVLVGRLVVEESPTDQSAAQPAANASSPAASADPPDGVEPKSLP